MSYGTRPPRLAESRRFRAVMALEGGEEVVTVDGIVGRVAAIADGCLEVEIAGGVRLRMGQKGIAEVRGAAGNRGRGLAAAMGDRGSGGNSFNFSLIPR
mgnify:CR=1 FL=1